MTNKTTTKGRKAVIYEEQLILNIIYNCIDDLKIKGKVKYSQVYKYALKKYNDGEYSFLKNSLSEDYWRKTNRQGKELIDKVNQIDEVYIATNANEENGETIIQTEDAINKLFNGNEKDKKKLIDHLRINEVKAKKFYKQTVKLQTELEKEKEQKEIWKNKAENLQTVLFQIMEYSASKDFPIENLINTGKSRKNGATNVLEQIFSDDPTLGFEFKDFQNKSKEKKQADEKIIPIKKKSSSATDDFGLF